MKQRTHKPKFLFATNFSWWLGSAGTGLTTGFRNEVMGRLPPTEVGGKKDSDDCE